MTLSLVEIILRGSRMLSDIIHADQQRLLQVTYLSRVCGIIGSNSYEVQRLLCDIMNEMLMLSMCLQLISISPPDTCQDNNNTVSSSLVRRDTRMNWEADPCMLY